MSTQTNTIHPAEDLALRDASTGALLSEVADRRPLTNADLEGLTDEEAQHVLRCVRGLRDGTLSVDDLDRAWQTTASPAAAMQAVDDLIAGRTPLPFPGCPAWCVHPEQCAAEVAANPWTDLGHDGQPTTITSTELEVTLARRHSHRPADEPYEFVDGDVKILLVSRVWHQEVDAFLTLQAAQDLADALVSLTTEVQA